MSSLRADWGFTVVTDASRGWLGGDLSQVQDGEEYRRILFYNPQN